MVCKYTIRKQATASKYTASTLEPPGQAVQGPPGDPRVHQGTTQSNDCGKFKAINVLLVFRLDACFDCSKLLLHLFNCIHDVPIALTLPNR